jgi:hypothetical protein
MVRGTEKVRKSEQSFMRLTGESLNLQSVGGKKQSVGLHLALQSQTAKTVRTDYQARLLNGLWVYRKAG